MSNELLDQKKRFLRDGDGDILAEYIPWCKNMYASKYAPNEALQAFKKELEEDGYKVVSIVKQSDSRKGEVK